MFFTPATEPLFLSGMVLLWLLLVFLLVRGTYRAYLKDKTAEMIVLGVAAGALIFFTGQYALLFTWAAGCEMGLPLGCIL